MIGDIMYELPLFGEWKVVRSAGALLAATHDRGAQGNTHGRGTPPGNTHGRAPTGS